MKTILSLVGAVMLGAPASAQVLQLVEVQPGISVVRDFDREVFFADGYYWHAGSSGWWYRAREYRSTWEPVQRSDVPPGLIRLPRGHYARYR